MRRTSCRRRTPASRSATGTRRRPASTARGAPLAPGRERFGDLPLYGVLGGLQLAGAAMESLIPDTVQHLKPFGLKEIVPAHCTGWRALFALVQTFGESVVTPSAVGSRFHFGS